MAHRLELAVRDALKSIVFDMVDNLCSITFTRNPQRSAGN